MINRNLKILFEFKDRIKLLIMFIANIFSAIFELIGIGSIPIFAMIIVDVDTFMLKISKYVSTDIFEGMSNQTITIYAASIMILIFILKNVLLFFINLIQARLLKNLRSITSNKLFEYYITLPYLEIMNKNPATLIRTMETDITYEYIDALSQVYTEYFFRYQDTPLVIINTNNIDFVNNEKDLAEVIQYIRQPVSGTKFFNPVSDL